MKKISLFIFFLIILSTSCDDGHKTFYNEQGFVIQENFKVANDYDSVVTYGYYKNGRKRSVTRSLARKQERFYTDECTYDSVTGERRGELLLDKNAFRVRQWIFGYDEQFDRVVIANHYCSEEEEYMIDSSNNKLFLVYYALRRDEYQQTHEYDNEGKIMKVSLINYRGDNDSVIFYKTPEEKNAFRDTLLLRAEKIKVPFPTGN